MTATIHCAGCQHAYIETALFCPNCGRPKVREAPSDPLLGSVLGERFLVQELLGQGGSGSIYRAEHVTLRRKVAIKVLHNELSRDDLAVERFRREATTVAEIDNEHIVEIHDFGRTHDGRLYLAMELLEGETLDGVLARDGQLSIERAADILIQVGEALMEAHAIGYVHRDLRPRNIYLSVRRGKANFVKLLDFGLAKLVETEGQAASTSLGMTFGDPRYMSPEQARGDRIDRRADIYQLGCVAYEMLTGAPPFSGGRVFDILTKQVTEAPQPLPSRRPGVPLWMEAAVAKMLAKDSTNRFATTTRMVEALRLGLTSGEVMEDEVARRRESIPPPSVSRVMQKMGISVNESGPMLAAPAAAATSAPVIASGPMASAQVPGALPAARGGAPSMPAGNDLNVTMRAAVPPFAPTGFERPAAPVAASPAAPPVSVERAKPDSVELLRKRTGTPRVGVPIVSEAAGAPPLQPPVAGVIDPPRPPIVPSGGGGGLRTRDTESVQVRSPSQPDAQPRGKRAPSVASDFNISQVWYDEGDQLDDEDASARTLRSRRIMAPGSADTSFEEERPRRPWGLYTGVGLVAVFGAIAAYALTREPASSPAPAPVVQTAPVATPPAQSTILPSGTAPEPPGSAAENPAGTEAAKPASVEATKPADVEPTKPASIESTKPASEPVKRAVVQRAPEPRTPVATRAPARATTKQAAPAAKPPAAPALGSGGGGFAALGAEPARRGPALPTGTGAVAPASAAPPSTAAPSTASTSSGLTDQPKDPYGDDTPAEAAPPEKKAEFFVGLGSQQLGSGDTANAAASFKKALELDAKSSTALMGLGEIALRQGLFGDAIAHLTKAARYSPKNSKVFTLLGEAYLNSGNNPQAAAQFKKALVLDPDNARARDGYNEASSRAAPPEDDL